MTMGIETCSSGIIRTPCIYCKKTFSPYYADFPSHQEIVDFCACGTSSDCKTNSTNAIDNVRKALCKFVASGEHSFSIIEEPAFREMMCALCPNFDTITKQTLLTDALKYHREERMIVETDLFSSPGQICLVINNLRKKNTVEEYVCVTACWIDHNWRLQKRIIRLLPLTPASDGVSLAEEMLLKLCKWKTEKVISFILDDASYSDSLVASLRSHLQRKQAFGELFHVRSYSHIIRLLGQSSLNLVDDVLPKIRNIVMHLKHSITKQKKFYEDAQMSFGLDTTKRLCIDSSITWDSTFLMLDVFLYYRNVIENHVNSDMDANVYCLSQEEWAKVDELHKFLMFIYKRTDGLSSSKQPISNIYFASVWKIHRMLLQISNDPSNILSSMVKEIQPKFAKYWFDFNFVLACSAVFDPRFKLKGVEFCYEKLYEKVHAKEMIVTLKNTLFDLFDYYNVTNAAKSPRVGTSEVGGSQVDERSDWDLEFEAWDASNRVEKSELEVYLDCIYFSIHEHLDVLEYWKNESDKVYGQYPILSIMARDILTIPLSLSPMESGFSLEEKVITPCRSSLSPKTIEALTCYGDWLREKGSLNGPIMPPSYILDAVLDKEIEEDEAEKMESLPFFVEGPCSSACSKFDVDGDEMQKENEESEEDEEEKMNLLPFYVDGPCSSACSKFDVDGDEM